MSTTVNAFGASAAEADLAAMTIERRAPGEHDVQIQILYCGVCHSDLHTVRNDWKGSRYPVVPGHEIIGQVVATGSAVSRFSIGDKVGVGCMVDSCRSCSACQDDLEQFCENGATFTYNSPDQHLGGHTYGGYSEAVVVHQDFVISIPANLDLQRTAPLLCAGITTYSPLRHWGITAGQKVGVIGLGGLGHMGIKFAKALEAKVVMITTSPGKGEDAKNLGADEVLISTDKSQMKAHTNSFDFLLNTIPVRHDLNPYMRLLKRDRTMVLVGAIEPLDSLHGGSVIYGRKHISGSLIGGIKETQEMMHFCAAHNITSDVEVIKMQDINEAYTRMQKSEVKYRFVIDMASLKDR